MDTGQPRRSVAHWMMSDQNQLGLVSTKTCQQGLENRRCWLKKSPMISWPPPVSWRMHYGKMLPNLCSQKLFVYSTPFQSQSARQPGNMRCNCNNQLWKINLSPHSGQLEPRGSMCKRQISGEILTLVGFGPFSEVFSLHLRINRLTIRAAWKTQIFTWALADWRAAHSRGALCQRARWRWIVEGFQIVERAEDGGNAEPGVAAVVDRCGWEVSNRCVGLGAAWW